MERLTKKKKKIRVEIKRLTGIGKEKTSKGEESKMIKLWKRKGRVKTEKR